MGSSRVNDIDAHRCSSHFHIGVRHVFTGMRLESSQAEVNVIFSHGCASRLHGCVSHLHGWGKPSHYYTSASLLVYSCIVVAGLAPAMQLFAKSDVSGITHVALSG